MLAAKIQDFAWENLLERLNGIAREKGLDRYRDAMADYEIRSEIQAAALMREAKEMLRHYLEAGNGQISELDAIELVAHIAKTRQYFQATPNEEEQDRSRRTRYDKDEEAVTTWEKLGDLRSKALRETVRELAHASYVGDIRLYS